MARTLCGSSLPDPVPESPCHRMQRVATKVEGRKKTARRFVLEEENRKNYSLPATHVP